MINTQALANTILMRSFDEGIPITPLKLQKLIFFVYSRYLCKYNEPLFSEQFCAWRYGPVLQSIYYEFNAFGANSITRFARDAVGDVYVVNSCETNIIDIINSVWSDFGRMTAAQLSNLTHQKGSAWDIAKEKGRRYITDEDIQNAERDRYSG